MGDAAAGRNPSVAIVGFLALAVGLGWFRAAPATAGEPAAAANPPLTFGVVLPLTGNREAHGQSLLAGAKMRTEEINARGGIGGRLLRLEVIDTRSNIEEAAKAVGTLADKPEVLAIVGPQSSGEFAAMRDPAKARKIVVIAPKATQDGLTANNPYLFRVIFNNGSQGTAMARFLVERLKCRRLAIFADGRASYAVSLADNFRTAAKKAGATIVFDETFMEGADTPNVDYRPALTRIEESEAEAAFMPAYADEVQLLVRQAAEVGLRTVLCGGDSWDIESVFLGSGRRFAGSYMVSAFLPSAKTPEVEHFINVARRWGMEQPESSAALSYDTVGVLTLALEKAKTQDREGIRDALAKEIRDYPGATGMITINADGEASKSIYIVKAVPGPNGYTLELTDRIDPEK